MLRHVASIGLLLLLVLTGGALCQTLYGRWCSGGNVRGVARVCVFVHLGFSETVRTFRFFYRRSSVEPVPIRCDFLFSFCLLLLLLCHFHYTIRE